MRKMNFVGMSTKSWNRGRLRRKRPTRDSLKVNKEIKVFWLKEIFKSETKKKEDLKYDTRCGKWKMKGVNCVYIYLRFSCMKDEPERGAFYV